MLFRSFVRRQHAEFAARVGEERRRGARSHVVHACATRVCRGELDAIAEISAIARLFERERERATGNRRVRRERKRKFRTMKHVIGARVDAAAGSEMREQTLKRSVFTNQQDDNRAHSQPAHSERVVKGTRSQTVERFSGVQTVKRASCHP